MSEQFPPVKAPSAYDGDYKLNVKPRRSVPFADQTLAIGCLVVAVLTVFLFAVAIFAFAVTR